MTNRILAADPLGRLLTAARTASVTRDGVPDEAGLRDLLRATLTSVLLGPVALAEYLDALPGPGTGPGPERPAIAVEELPTQRLLAEGLSALSDAQLVRVAVSPDAVRGLNAAVETALLDGTAGPAWWSAVDLPDDILPPDYLPPERARRLAADAAAATRQAAPPADPPAVVPRSVADAKPAGGFRLRWASLAALAASVLGFGVLLGTQFRGAQREVASLTPDELSRDLPPGTRDSLLRRWGGKPRGEVLLGEARTRPDIVRGPESFLIEVQNTDDRRAYVTIVGLVAGKRPAFQTKAPDGGRDQWIAVEPGATRPLIPSQNIERAETFLIVLTPTPAGEVVREFVLQQPPAATAEAVRDAATTELKRLGYPSLNTVLVRPPAGKP